MSKHALGTWIFGKYPTLGDFVTHGVPHYPKEQLDRWLTMEMHEAKLAFGEMFPARFDTAPAWNFVDESEHGVCFGGILCASTDKAHRRFPLVMATPARNLAEAAQLSVGCHSLLLSAFAEHWPLAQLGSAQVIPEGVDWSPTGSEWALLGEDGPVQVVRGQMPNGLITAALEVAL